jgi:hypothetical protein
LAAGYMLPSREGHQIAAIGLGNTMKTSGKSTRDAYSLFEYAIPLRTDGPYLPRDVVHTFRNTYDEEARVISVVSLVDLEGYYQALADVPPGPKDIGKIKQIMADFGLVLQLPPEVR